MKYILILLNILFSSLLFAQNHKQMMSNLDYENRVVVHYIDYKVEAFVYGGERSIRPDDDKFYSWFASHDIKSTQGGFDGKLLHGEYTAFYSNKNLKEKGIYRYGLKNGVWKKWNFSGSYIEIVSWKKGKKNGRYVLYDNEGNKTEEGDYSNGLLNGKVKYYSNGEVTTKKFKKGSEVEIKTFSLLKKRKTEPAKEKKGFSIPFIKKQKSSKETLPEKGNSNPSKGQKEKPKKEKKSNIKIRKSIKVIPLPNDQT